MGCLIGVNYIVKYNKLKNSDDKSLNLLLKDLQTQVSTLTKENLHLIDNNEYLKMQVNALKETLNDERELSKSQIDDLQNRIRYLEELIEAFNAPNMIAVTFYSNNIVYDVLLVESDGYVDISKVVNPIMMGYEFEYWTMDGETEFDFSTYQVTEEFSVIAKFKALQNSVTVNFVSSDTGYTSYEYAGRVLNSHGSPVEMQTQKYFSGETVVYDIYTENSFSFDISNYGLKSSYDKLDGSKCEISFSEIEKLELNDKSLRTYHVQMTISNIDCNLDVDIHVVPVKYTLRIVNSADNDNEVFAENLVYGRRFSLKDHMNEEDYFYVKNFITVTGVTPSGLYEFPHAQGTKYFDYNLDSLCNFTYNGYDFDGSNYNKRDDFNEETKTLTLYIGF